MQINLEEISALSKIKILDNCIIPRPIAWIVTVNNQGVINLAPFSFFAPVSSEPIIFSVCFYSKSDGDLKDTFKNIIREKKASICICESDQLGLMHASSQELPSTESEAVKFNIPMQAIVPEYPPIVKKSRIAFMCDYFDLLDIGKYSKTLLLEAKELFVANELYPDFDAKIHAVGHSGKEYQMPGEKILMKSVK
ncbi:flavin reductase [Helicobacter sp. faydin-H20]|uniref:flavin reductase family protein n=1 Tax=Helicobacter anatolicus TaxID=2905874 RepID=UPI001E406044|nr:flavin reductase [Helicobacter anatolicus]MCE3036948.1 flavin reductase [Helicobacter anatolicus]